MDGLLTLSNDLAAAVEHAARAVVGVNGRRRLGSTGVHWRHGLVVTADHTVDIDEEIPVEHYQAVAEVIGYVLRLKGRRAYLA